MSRWDDLLPYVRVLHPKRHTSPKPYPSMHAPNSIDLLLPLVGVHHYYFRAICTAAVRQVQVLGRNRRVEHVLALRLRAVIVRLAAC